MAFILPDNILDTLLCSFCHKYLSVKPVKIYPNRLIQCGRCVENKEHSIYKLKGVESLFGRIAQKILFKCVNRFDGCRELLTYSQVRDHEQACLEKNHRCPICYEEMASFLMLRHFYSNHKYAVLDCPAFVFNLKDHLEMPSVYLYQEEDNLFFLYISYRKSENAIKLDLVYMGCSKLATNIYHQFTVRSEKKEFDIVLDPKPCTNDFFVVDVLHMSNLIQIKFKIIDHNLMVLTAPGVSNAVGKHILQNPESISKNAPHEKQIGKYLSKFNQKCIKCQAFCIFSLTRCPILTYYTNIYEYNNYMCYYCYNYFKSDEWLICKVYFKILIPINIFETMEFFKWYCRNCCSEIKISDIQAHEINCKRGRQFTCPRRNCCEKGTANHISKHLKDRHYCMAFGSQFKLPINFFRCYVFVREYIVFLHVTPTSDFASLELYDIHVELVTKNDEKIPYALFFNNNNELLTGGLKLASCSEVFVKVIIY
ncbi:uncharacterized protein LOC126891686 [Diabrotica virgifera virgifera]|uniref:SIAH-type domain-containing protein n=1 Tax=Diabrotica virgifera virgifera TaxID=50390 RepID=A0ABM5L362_DIAVI|nr:uncharacterized protein LOC126891686 [Diabrotica virgifera virgifera]